jgi:hypothetical protein
VAHYAIARRDVGDLRTNLKHNCPGLMAQQMRKKLVRTFDSVDLADLRAADAAHEHFHENLAELWRGHLDLLDHEGFFLLDEDRSAGFHSYSK